MDHQLDGVLCCAGSHTVFTGETPYLLSNLNLQLVPHAFIESTLKSDSLSDSGQMRSIPGAPCILDADVGPLAGHVSTTCIATPSLYSEGPMELITALPASCAGSIVV